MIDAGGVGPIGNGEIDLRILQHPFRIILLQHRRLGSEERGVETYRPGEIIDRDMDRRGRTHLVSPAMAAAAAIAGRFVDVRDWR